MGGLLSIGPAHAQPAVANTGSRRLVFLTGELAEMSGGCTPSLRASAAHSLSTENCTAGGRSLCQRRDAETAWADLFCCY
jgi:hypothetical protein